MSEQSYRPEGWLEGEIELTAFALANPDCDARAVLRGFAAWIQSASTTAPAPEAPAEPLTGHRSDCAKHGDDEHDSTPWKECDCGADGPTKEWYRKRCDWYSGELDRLRAQLATQQAALRRVLTNEVIRAVGALARQTNVCREQGGQVVFVTGIEAAREYLIEQLQVARLLAEPGDQ